MKTCPHCAAEHDHQGHCCSHACGSAWVSARRDKARGFTDADVLRLIDERLTLVAICDALGTHGKTVRQIARRSGRVVFDPAVQWTDNMWTTAKEMRDAGAIHAVIGEHLGVSESAVKNRFYRAKRRSGSSLVKKEPEVPMQPIRVREPIAPPMPQVPTPIPRLIRDGCAWPIGEGRAVRFCGAPEVLGKPYCEACCRVAYPRWSVAA